jgi:hypothetical protein
LSTRPAVLTLALLFWPSYLTRLVVPLVHALEAGWPPA